MPRMGRPRRQPDRPPRFVAGAIGPLTVSLSNSPDADDAGFRSITFDQVRTAYAQQVRALIAAEPICSSSKPSSTRSTPKPHLSPFAMSTTKTDSPRREGNCPS